MADAALAALHPRAYASRFLARGVRPDGRATHACRRVTLALGTLGSADGSATVRLGAGTSVVAAVSVELQQLAGAAAAALAPDGGGGGGAPPPLAVELTLPPMASPRFRARGGGPAAQLALKRGPQIAREIERLVAACQLLDPRQLVLEEGVCGLRLVVDVLATAADGNLEDAALLAAVAALSATTIPAAGRRPDGSGAWELRRGGGGAGGAAGQPAAGAAGDSSSSSSSSGGSSSCGSGGGGGGGGVAAAAMRGPPPQPLGSGGIPPARLAVRAVLVPTSFALLQLVDPDLATAAATAEEEADGDAPPPPPPAVLVSDPDDSEEALAGATVRVVVAVPLPPPLVAGGGGAGSSGDGGVAAGAAGDDRAGASHHALAGVVCSGAPVAVEQLGACAALAQARAASVAAVLQGALAARAT
jgi:exosome complex component RRP43